MAIFQLISNNEISTDTVLLEVSPLLKQINFLTRELTVIWLYSKAEVNRYGLSKDDHYYFITFSWNILFEIIKVTKSSPKGENPCNISIKSLLNN